jgi:hypothetical protein
MNFTITGNIDNPNPALSLSFFNVCFALSDRLLKWSDKYGFYTSFQIREGFSILIYWI